MTDQQYLSLQAQIRDKYGIELSDRQYTGEGYAEYLRDKYTYTKPEERPRE